MRYPEARRLDLVEDLHGHQVADPYRWLEDAEAEEAEAWSQAQDALCAEVLAAAPGRDHLRRRLRQLLPGVVGPPAVRGDRRFFLRRTPEQEHAVYCVEEPGGDVRPLVDPAAIDPTLATTLDAAVPSHDGRLLAVLLSEGGREESTLRVHEVDTMDVVDGPIPLGRVGGGGVAWLPDGDGYVYVRADGQFDRRVRRRKALASDPDGDEVLFGEGRDRTTYYGIHTSLDGRWLLVSSSLGTAPRNDLHLLDLTTGRWRTVQEGVDGQTYGIVRDDRLYLHTTLGSPRGRLVTADAEQPEPDHWTDLLPETDHVLADWCLTADAVVAVHTHHVVSRVTVHDRATGARRDEVSLPGLGDATVSSRPDGGDDVWIGYTDHVTPFRVLHWSVAERQLSTWAEPPGAEAVEGITARQVFVTSRDGTQVPMFVLAADGVDPASGPHPTVLYGYGGFNVPLTPAYSSAIVTWVEAGGVWCVANLRGGSEYGEEWHRAGMREHKQNVFDDFLASAAWLVEDGWTDADHLAISGGSNGGLLVGAALTQAPDRFRAVACSAPLLDMVRYERFGLGETWNDEYGRADDPTELGWLLSYSPYHHVREGTRYPAVIFTVFEGDTRVDPLHARKLCAALQHATSAPPAERPVVIRRETQVGHGARAVSRTVELSADTLGFLAHQVGLRWPG